MRAKSLTIRWRNAPPPQTGEERLVGKPIGVRSGEVTQPTESVGTQHVSDRADTATGSGGMVGYSIHNMLVAAGADLQFQWRQLGSAISMVASSTGTCVTSPDVSRDQEQNNI
jgi:hypothetical protein